MPYSAEISRANPAVVLFLLDESGSMVEPFGAQPDRRKADGVADALNRLLQNIVLKCAKADGIRDFFHVGMICYGSQVRSAFGGPLAGETLVPVSKIAANPLRVETRARMVEDRAGGLVERQFKFPVWFEAHPGGKTPMCEAMRQAKQTIQAFLAKHPGCYPPLVINITDGHPTDGDPREAAHELRGLTSKDGHVLLFNAHVSEKHDRPVEYPEEESVLPDDFARLLFRMSSPLPPRLIEAAKAEGLAVGPKSRGFVFNADLVAAIRFLDIGTRVAQGLH